MALSGKQDQYAGLMQHIAGSSPSSWQEISDLLSQIKEMPSAAKPYKKDEFLHLVGQGVAFITFEYGIDGVSIEITKYAKAIEAMYKDKGGIDIHLLGGGFSNHADYLLKPIWRRNIIEGANGWDKWEGGEWFNQLFFQDIPENDPDSDHLAAEIFTRTVKIADTLGKYLVEHNISMLIPVNIASNPGNMALILAVVIVSEAMGIYVVNSNHDFYWEGGKTAREKTPDDQPGPRDHFFRNQGNLSFYSLFQSIYPWNGGKWIQANINQLQSTRLIKEFGLPEERICVLPTSISDKFFGKYQFEDVKSARLRMGYILSDGEEIIHPFPVSDFMLGLKNWMGRQRPAVLGARAGLVFDPTADDLIYLLQPTRIIARKRIERDLELIGALLTKGPFRDEFEKNNERQLILHVTGPIPIEHQVDLETILGTYIDVISNLPDSISDRIFLAFSVGNETHSSFKANQFRSLSIRQIYIMATAILFPSETEGRGLPIIEASACGKPIICSRYEPVEVFAGVIGEHLPEAQQILYTHFPEAEFSEAFLAEVSQIFLHPEYFAERMDHNREAVRQRYSLATLVSAFEKIFDQIRA